MSTTHILFKLVNIFFTCHTHFSHMITISFKSLQFILKTDAAFAGNFILKQFFSFLMKQSPGFP